MARDLPTRTLLQSALGPLLATLLDEAPERAAWLELSAEQIHEAIRAAQTRSNERGMKLGFRTLLKQQLDDACDLAPAPMEFETPYLGHDDVARRPASRAWRDDRDARKAESRAEERKKELWEQARRLMREE